MTDVFIEFLGDMDKWMEHMHYEIRRIIILNRILSVLMAVLVTIGLVAYFYALLTHDYRFLFLCGASVGSGAGWVMRQVKDAWFNPKNKEYFKPYKSQVLEEPKKPLVN